MERDVKGIYAKFKNGKVKNVAGLDLEFPVPKNADLLIKNSGSKETLISYSSQIADIISKNKWVISILLETF